MIQGLSEASMYVLYQKEQEALETQTYLCSNLSLAQQFTLPATESLLWQI